MKGIRTCKICGKDIICVLDKTLGSTRKKSHMMCFSYSDEGVMFKENIKGKGFWFCNDCWDEIIKYYSKWKNK